VKARRDRDLLAGPARLTQAFGVTGVDNGNDLVRGPIRILDDGVDLVRGPVRLYDDGTPPPHTPGISTRVGLRVGLGDELLWRYFVPDEVCVSGPARRRTIGEAGATDAATVARS